MAVISPSNVPVPRYTSYPPAPFWGEREAVEYPRALEAYGRTEKPLSLYVHIPFCKKRCLFCGCHVVLNRMEAVATRYVETLKAEIDLLKRHFGKGYPVRLLHLGGGTPTHLNCDQMEDLVKHLQGSFVFLDDAELSIELDARTLEEDPKKLPQLRALGFNRVSFGVQDTDEAVQRAVHRDQSLEVTAKQVKEARNLGFESLCIELIYGLPFQTKKSFHQTIQDVIALRPDRIALYSFAMVPWIKPHQKAIGEKNMPTPELKLSLYMHARAELTRAGYTLIGMDHFALPHDSLAQAKERSSLVRCFQGYTTEGMDANIGLGVSSIGFFGGEYFQNVKELTEYEALVNAGTLPAHRGFSLSDDDLIRKWTIHRLMCHFSLNKLEFAKRFGRAFDAYFEKALERLPAELALNSSDAVVATEKGCLFIRNVASCFDAYYDNQKTIQFSRSI